MIYTLCFILMAVGLYGIVTRKNLIKIVISLLVLEHAIHLFLILIGYAGTETVPPIVDPTTAPGFQAADPLPQALVLTSIVIGLGVLALLVTLCLRLYERYGTFDVTEMRKLKG